MNRKVLIVLALTVIALFVLTIFSFGPLAGLRKNSGINRASLTPTTSETVAATGQNLKFNVYHNRDLQEDFYSIKLPEDWQLEKPGEPGKYSLTTNGGFATVELIDVPDNTTLELYVLSQEEPRLKRTIPGYGRIEYKKMMVDSADAFELTYAGKLNGEDYRTIRTYITGQNRAGMITLSAIQSKFAGLEPLYSSIITSFHWENK